MDELQLAGGMRAQSCYFKRDGARLHLLRWNWAANAGKPAVLLVHGFLAHAHWWDMIAPVLARDFRVAALDISGMGDSDARADYPSDWAALDILAAIDFLDIAPATVVAHSYGGSRTLLASAMRPGAIARAVVLDTFYNFVGEHAPGSPPPGPRKVYASLEEALRRYRLLPSEAYIPEAMLRHVASHSLKKFGDGWSWKFDPGLSIQEEEDGAAILRRVDACVDYVVAENSDLVSAERAKRIFALLPNKRLCAPLVFPRGHHHFLLEDPSGTAQLIHSLLCNDPALELV